MLHPTTEDNPICLPCYNGSRVYEIMSLFLNVRSVHFQVPDISESGGPCCWPCIFRPQCCILLYFILSWVKAEHEVLKAPEHQGPRCGVFVCTGRGARDNVRARGWLYWTGPHWTTAASGDYLHKTRVRTPRMMCQHFSAHSMNWNQWTTPYNQTTQRWKGTC